MKRFLLPNLACRRFSSQVAASPKATEPKPVIRIPQKIHRSPTDILKAIASTITDDPTSYDYRYHDDPALAPTSLSAKREFAISKASGRRAAKYFLTKYPQCFDYNPAVPDVPDFNPKPKIYKKGRSYQLEDLIYCLEVASVRDAKIVYESLEKSEVPEELKLQLLQLLCFHNGEDPCEDELIEEAWFRNDRITLHKTWNCVEAETLFEELENRNALAYSTMIQGYAKYFDGESAMRHYDEMRELGMTPSIHAYTLLINCAGTLFEDSALKLEFVMKVLGEIKEAKLRPTLDLFHACLLVTKAFGYGDSKQKLSLLLLNEMNSIGIPPSLGTFALILKYFQRNKAYIHDILPEVLDMIEKKVFQVRSLEDLKFFYIAMSACNNCIGDIDMALRINNAFNLNPHMVANNFFSLSYYNEFFLLLCKSGEVNEVMKWYRALVPHKYSPELEIMKSIFRAVVENDGFHYIPELWTGLCLCRSALRPEIRELVLKSCDDYEGDDKDLLKNFAEVTMDCRKRVDAAKETADNSHKTFTAPMVSYMVSIYMKAGMLEKAVEEMKIYLKDPLSSPGLLDEKVMLKYVVQVSEEGLGSAALECAAQAAEIGFGTVVDFVTLNADKYGFNKVQVESLKTL